MFRRCLYLILFVSVWTPTAALAAPLDAAVDAIFADALKTYPIPGLAVGIVRNDEVVYLKGYGVREAGGTDAVTPDTLFAIGSCTKAFTATALAQLVDDGDVSWNDPVRKHVPYFRLSDPLADREVTLRDLLCHRTGLSRHDWLWYHAPWSVEETVRRMAALPRMTSFRSTYEYNNLCYITAGLAIEGAAKRPWHDVVQQRLFDKLNMKGAVFTRSAALKAPDHATPHRVADGKAVVTSWYSDDQQIRASGSIKAGVRDLSQWLRLQLNGGVYDGKRIVSAKALAETHTPQMVVPVAPESMPLAAELAALTEKTQASYGLGWHISDYRGRLLWQHGGAVDGFRAHILLAPKEKIGIVVLGNSEAVEAVLAASYQTLDHLLGLEKRDWNGYYVKLMKHVAAAAKMRKERFEAGRDQEAKPSLDLEAYAGTYEDAAYGTLTITQKEGVLRWQWSGFEGRLEPYKGDSFACTGAERLENELAQFALGTEKDVTAVKFLGRTFRRVQTR